MSGGEVRSSGGNLEHASETQRNNLGFHCSTKSYYINWRVQRWIFGLRSRFLDSQVSAEQLIIGVNQRPARYI